MELNLPPVRVREVLGLLKDLKPDEARVLLCEVVETLDAAEVIALRKQLPAGAMLALPAAHDTLKTPFEPEDRMATVMNEAPMPWEFMGPRPSSPRPVRVGFETSRIIRDVMPSAVSRRMQISIAVALAAVVLGFVTLIGYFALRPAESLASTPPPVARPVVERAAVAEAPREDPPPVPLKVTVARKKPARSSARIEAHEWASPYERRH